jgi:hypothetical protein
VRAEEPRNTDAASSIACEHLADCLLRSALLFHLDEDGGLRGRMAKGKVGSSLPRLVLGPHDRRVERLPFQIPGGGEERSLAQTACSLGNLPWRNRAVTSARLVSSAIRALMSVRFEDFTPFVLFLVPMQQALGT